MKQLTTTYQPKAKEIKRAWHFRSARGQVLGRLATEVVRLLMGKHKKTYSPHLDNGDYVVVVDSKEVILTGKKNEQKAYKRYSGYPSGLHIIPVSRMREKHPERIIEHAVSGMLPDNRLKRLRMNRLKVFAGSEHPYRDRVKEQESEGV